MAVDPKKNKPMLKHNPGDVNQIAREEMGKRTMMHDPISNKNFEDGWDYYKRHNPQAR
jgi:hypothetical protein